MLDVGCGRGRNALYLAQEGFAVYGCDLSPLAVKVAKERARQEKILASFQVADLTRLPYSDRQFAAVVCIHVLPYHLTSDIFGGVRELWRVLQPGGWLCLDLLDCDDAEYGCGPELEEHTFWDPDGVPIHFSSRREVDELLSDFMVERLVRLELGSSPRVRVAWAVWATKFEMGAEVQGYCG